MATSKKQTAAAKAKAQKAAAAAKLKASAAKRKEREAAAKAKAKVRETNRKDKRKAAEAKAKGAQIDAYRALAPTAKEINYRLGAAETAEDNAYDHRLTAALQCAEAKRICSERHVAFKPWAEENLQHSYETVRKYVRIGQSDNPQEALTLAREANRLANHALRDRLAISGSNSAKGAKAKGGVSSGPSATPTDRIIAGFNAVDEDAGAKLIKTHALNYGLVAVPQSEAATVAKLRKQTPREQAETVFALFTNPQKVEFVQWAAAQIGVELVGDFSASTPEPLRDDAGELPTFLDRRSKKAGGKNKKAA